MSYKEMSRRLEDLEVIDKERQGRVYNRVLNRLSASDYDCFTAYVTRWGGDHDADPSADEWQVLHLVEPLTLEDSEMRLGDLIGLDMEHTA